MDILLDLFAEHDALNQYQNLKSPQVQTSPPVQYTALPPAANVLLAVHVTCSDISMQINLLCLPECMSEINSSNLTNVAC
jgi:hypothetical protein